MIVNLIRALAQILERSKNNCMSFSIYNDLCNYNNISEYSNEYKYEQEHAIVAQATAVGFGGVGIVRVSGCSKTILFIINNILKTKLKPRYAYYGNFYSINNNHDIILDKGLALYFKSPNSYTGEDILELHCHGGPVVIQNIIDEILSINNSDIYPDYTGLNIKLADPGEFTKRAWLNGKIDLAQAEAVSDLINAGSKQAAISAANSLTGKFSEVINKFLLELISLRTFVEAAIDFSEEQIDFLENGDVLSRVNNLLETINNILSTTKQGVILQEGVNIVLAGKPNAGKSSLLNLLCKQEEAIVTDIPGTTRDIIKTKINIKGLPINLIDTAGIRFSDNIVEKKGIDKALDYISKADLVLLIIDLSNKEDFELIKENNISKVLENNNIGSNFILNNIKNKNILVIGNKIDKINKFEQQNITNINKKLNTKNYCFVSALNNFNINKLEEKILEQVGFKQTTEGVFSARRRHLDAISQVQSSIIKARDLLNINTSIDLVAEELKLAQDYLGQITGEYLPDDLLGNIFSDFCVGK